MANDFLSELLEAQQARLKLPEVTAELERTKGEHEVTRSKLNGAWTTVDQLNQQIDAMQEQLRLKEAELAQSTKSEHEAREKLSIVASIMHDVGRDITDTIALVEPPKPEPIVEPIPVPNDLASTEPQSSDGSTPVGGTNIHGIGPDEANGPNPDYIEPTSTAEEGPSDATPTASLTADASQPAVSPSADPAPVTSPFRNRPYWTKPADVSWVDFMAGGGERAPWVSIDGVDHSMADVAEEMRATS